ncbi:MAG: ABC transporter substrate-binding protein [Candidatus Saccharibacteria bacterium]
MTSYLRQFLSFVSETWRGIKALPGLRRNQIPLVFESLTKKDLLAIAAFGAMIVATGGFLIFGNRGQSGTVPDYGGEYTEGLIGQPRFINPVLASSSSADTDLSKLIYAQLLKFDKNLQLVPDLAAAFPEISQDQKTYTLRLKDNLKWQDGKPLTADDVVFTINTIQNADYESPLKTNWSRVRVEKIDDLSVRLTLREVSASFITNFTVGILPKHIWEGLPANSFRLSDLNLRPVGSGPFAVREIKKTADGTITSLTLRANDNYYEGRPYLDRITFKFYSDQENLLAAYHGRDISAMGYVPFDKKAFVEPSSKTGQYRISLPQYQAVFFNLPKSAVLADKSVRQALWLATDRNDLINQVYSGFAQAAYGPILEGNLGYNPQVKDATHFSLDEASAILNKGGWTMDANTKLRTRNKTPLQFNLVTSVQNVKAAQVLQSQWSKIGADVQLTVVSAADLEQQYIRPRNFDALLFSENTGADPDPFAFWHSTQTRDPGLNLSGFSNPDVDKLLTGARQTNDTNVRTADYKQFQTIVTNEIPAIFLDSAVYVYNVPKKLQGLDLTTVIHPSERFLDINHWYINTK